VLTQITGWFMCKRMFHSKSCIQFDLIQSRFVMYYELNILILYGHQNNSLVLCVCRPSIKMPPRKKGYFFLFDLVPVTFESLKSESTFDNTETILEPREDSNINRSHKIDNPLLNGQLMQYLL
jgi:hypothetical protein